MNDASPEEVRVRVTVDSDTPELLQRLAGSKRQAREIVYLLRLGLQMEKMLSGKVPMVGATADVGVPAPAQASPLTVTPVPVAAPIAVVSTGIPSAEAFSEMSGLDADYFSAPVTYQD